MFSYDKAQECLDRHYNCSFPYTYEGRNLLSSYLIKLFVSIYVCENANEIYYV